MPLGFAYSDGDLRLFSGLYRSHPSRVTEGRDGRRRAARTAAEIRRRIVATGENRPRPSRPSKLPSHENDDAATAIGPNTPMPRRDALFRYRGSRARGTAMPRLSEIPTLVGALTGAELREERHLCIGG